MDYPELTFEKADQETFKNLALAYQALDLGGTAACALNAANEITNSAFLHDKIKFLDIANINEKVMQKATFVKKPGIDDYVSCNTEARILATELL